MRCLGYLLQPVGVLGRGDGQSAADHQTPEPGEAPSEKKQAHGDSNLWEKSGKDFIPQNWGEEEKEPKMETRNRCFFPGSKLLPCLALGLPHPCCRTSGKTLTLSTPAAASEKMPKTTSCL